MEWFTAPDYWLSRIVFQRGLAGIYLVAFLAAALEFRALIGERGMLPVPDHLRRMDSRRTPSLFHRHYSDRLFAAVSWTGAVLALALVAGAGDAVPLAVSMLLWALLWGLYLSIVNVGQTWYAFGWESLLLETGFLAVLLGNDDIGPPLLVLVLLRWLLFRVEFGAGLIKIRGDRCWRDLTCLYHHHETQPMPGPLSWYFHRLPRPLHRAEAAANHVVQLFVPVLLFAPQPVATVAAGLMAATQLWLVLSGNFAWLNWLTIVLALSVMDGSALVGNHPRPAPPLWYVTVVCAATALVLALSYRPARNLVSRHQAMNRSYDPFHLVNSYGAFGTVGRVRHEIVVEGTDEPAPGPDTVWKEYGFKGEPGDPRRLPRSFAPYRLRPDSRQADWYKERSRAGELVLKRADREVSPAAVWREYGFRGKPSEPGRWPRQYAPWHLRLDWLLWFVALSPSYGTPWFDGFVLRLLLNDEDLLKLIRHNPFPDSPPTYIRCRLYRYRFTTWRELRETHDCWHRTYIRDMIPPVRLRPPPEP
ncbi:lipase maturation factor family protein [Streptomyces sp. NBC_01216]|uniref:lipase maturation factor family protein n=1 Tax=Streptomyces sp. NBC_01216 TaxID=2903778 RepID=UPI002E123D20|nr:lipase maturation factor family protein [Streptomyces sp. NBC_01216]